MNICTIGYISFHFDTISFLSTKQSTRRIGSFHFMLLWCWIGSFSLLTWSDQRDFAFFHSFHSFKCITASFNSSQPNSTVEFESNFFVKWSFTNSCMSYWKCRFFSILFLQWPFRLITAISSEQIHI